MGVEMKDRVPLVVSISLVVLSQCYFFFKPDYFLDGAILLAAGVVAFGILIRSIEKAPCHSNDIRAERISGRISRIGKRFWRKGLVLLSVFLSFWAGLRSLEGGDSSFDELAIWLAAMGLILLSFHRPRSGLSESAMSGPIPWAEIAVVSGVVFVGLLLRTMFLTDIPRNISGDSGTVGCWALDFLEGRRTNLFATGWFAVPTMGFYAKAVAMKVFGSGVLGLRVFSALVGTLALVTNYLLFRGLFGRAVAQIALILLATHDLHIHYSRVGIHHIVDTLLYGCALFCLLIAFREGREMWFVAAGLVAGLGWYFYFGARIIPLVFGLALLHTAFTSKLSARKFLVHSGLIALGFLVAAMPLLVYYHTQPEALFSRFNQVGIFQSGWLSQATQSTGQSEVVVILEQFKKAFFSISYYADRSFHYYPERPFLGFVASIFFVLGTVVSVIKLREKSYFWVLGSLVLILTFGAALLENPPQSQRLVLLAPVLAALVSIGIVHFSGLLAASVKLSKRTAGGISLACALWIGVSSVWFYFFEFTPRRTYGNPTAYIATEMARFINSQESIEEVVFFGAPFMYGDFG
ncbi:MAG TPA: glycosyltransferase family 39 protein, partial [Acidobacteriota bacterium]|nr:glycosyltransferase family 39 protein [Acidobacteriota bacterium]